MGVTLFEPPAFPIDEPQRDHCVEASGALLARNDPYLQSLVETARTRMHTAMAAISIVYRDWQYLIAASGIPAGVYSRRTSLCGHAILRPTELLYIPDATRDARFADNPIVGEDKTLRFYLAAPLVDSHGFALGTLCVFDPQPRADIARADAMELATLAHAVVERLVTLNDVAVRDAPPTVAARPSA